MALVDESVDGTATTTPDDAAIQDTVSVPVDPTERILQIVNDSAIAVLSGIGYQTGLFDTLAVLPPSTSRQIADAAGLDERYVREWLGGMVTGGFVDHDPAASTYALREDVTPFLTGPGVNNLARTMNTVSLISLAVPKVVECFRHGGGLAYEDYPGFHDACAQESAAVNDASLIDVIIPLTGITDRLTTGIDVADIGCGQGHAINLLAQAYPNSRFTGYDFSVEAIEAARAEADDMGLANAHFVVRDVAQLDLDEDLDLMCAFDTIHDQAHPAQVLDAVYASLRPGGTFLMVDIKASSALENNRGLPWASFLYTISTVHCMSVSLAQGGDGLGTVWGVELAEQMVREAGFASVERKDLEDDPFNSYFVARK